MTTQHLISLGHDMARNRVISCHLPDQQITQSAPEKLNQEKQAHKPLCTSWILHANVSTIIFWPYYDETFPHIVAAWSAFLALFKWSRRTTCAKDHRKGTIVEGYHAPTYSTLRKVWVRAHFLGPEGKLVLFTRKFWFIYMWIKLILIWKAFHWDLLWYRGERELRDRLFCRICTTSLC